MFELSHALVPVRASTLPREIQEVVAKYALILAVQRPDDPTGVLEQMVRELMHPNVEGAIPARPTSGELLGVGMIGLAAGFVLGQRPRAVAQPEAVVVESYWRVYGCSRAGRWTRRGRDFVHCGHEHLDEAEATPCVDRMQKGRPKNCQEYRTFEITVRVSGGKP